MPTDPAWDEYLRRRRAFRLSFLRALLWLIPGNLIRALLVSGGMEDGPAFILTVAIPSLGLIAVAHIRRMFTPCPRCGQAFHLTLLYGNTFSRGCLHCGQPLWGAVTAPEVSNPSRS